MSEPLPVTLVIDTAAARLQLGLLRPDGVVDTHVEQIGTGHAERVFPAIATLLARNTMAYADLERIAVTSGPGSFTGLRVGIAAARGIGLARGLPVLGVPSLLAVSLGADGPVTVAIDARRGEAYLQHFSAPGRPEGPPLLVPADTDLSPFQSVIASPFPDIAALALFAARADPLEFPPEPAYVREADAKPQTEKRIPRL